ncbi:NUDIX domain-containing protein [Nesterenkonia sp. E16_7]|uniref:NUDIX hydrolase n=1 Tax=unclassified Nesterenkonia TaxID=2629769 RepID=UPI001A925B09|nr:MULTISPECIES: NUDIX domain-containing protein [unclassified Nesterenkonia]MBO0596479.1 NUDIX domain-containing protein [Nesterenkonia sp. E16_10]MBO0597825.1 NUDIX domain-containing protein [Nesterenkonia sp. E16_7]
MGTPDFVLELREDVGHKELFLPGVTSVVVRRQDANGLALDEPEVLVVQRSDNGWWSAISGILEPGDSPASGALREVQEETGVHARIVRVAGVSAAAPSVYPNGDRCRFVDIAFELEWISGTPYVGDDESMKVGWFPASALPEPFVESHRERIEWALEAGAPARF